MFHIPEPILKFTIRLAFRAQRTPALAMLAAAVALAQTTATPPNLQQTAAQTEYFEKNVRPVFVKNCQMCHNAKAKTSQLDLTSASGFQAGGAGGPVVSKDRPEESRILKAIGYEESLKMPPMGKLKAEEIASITEWVKMGAPWPGAESAAAAPPAKPVVSFTPEQKAFWAFQPVANPTPPPVKDTAWVRTPVDRFVLAKLEEKGLQPAPPADKATLLRRVTFDLTGLPPTPEQMQAFLDDKSPDAFRKVVERLMASPQYGERWGRHWLDVARYADSTGNDEDHRYPYAWRYRDYVIDAFNQDLPYNQFIREQLAGDLLPASGAAADPDMPNRRGIVATGFLALGAKALAQTDKKKMLYDVYDEQVDVTSRAFLGLTMACARCHNHKFDPILSKDYYALVSMFASTKDFARDDTGVAQLLYVPLVPKQEYAVYKAHQDRMDALRTAIEAIDNAQRVNWVRANGSHMSEYMLAARSVNVDGKTSTEVAATASLDEPVLKVWVKYLKEGSKAHPQLADWDNSAPDRLAATANAYQARFQARFDEWSKVLEKWQADVQAAVAANTKPPAKPHFEPGKDQFFYEVFLEGPFSFSEPDDDKPPPKVKPIELIRSADAKDQIAAIQKQLAEMKASGPPEPDMACAVAEGQSVDQKVFARGDYNNPTEDAPKAFPTLLARPTDPPVKTTSGRLELANWLAGPQNPLPARVMVNRIWAWHFGDGIVRTPDNFGKMGDRPSNPELLDFLARQFVDGGWSVKNIQRLILFSSTYQMASDTDDKDAEADPENRLMTRFNRQRLDVEEIRDGVLALDGSLDPAMGGTLQKGTGTDGENSAGRLSLDPLKLTRRTVYLPLRRANLPTLLNLFDFGDATTVNGKRTITNVAPQALFAMNSEFGFEHSRKLAEMLLAMPDATPARRVEAAYLRILNRYPTSDEVDTVLTYMQKYSTKYGKDNADLEAWQSLCHILLSSNEFLYLD